MTSPVPALACCFPPSRDLPEHARIAESLGYERVWVFDSPALYGDVWVAIARVAEATDRIGVATGVAVGFLRHVMVTASAVATIEELAPGRLSVAIGTGFTGARAMGQKPMKWSDLATYVEQLRGLLRGDVVEVDGARCRMIHSPGYAPPRPIEVPLLLAPMGPKGFEVARKLADGVIVAAPPGSREFDPCALLCAGTVLEPGEDHTTPRVVETLGPSFATAIHGTWEFARDMVPSMPGGEAWLADLEANYDEADRHWAVHEGHMIAVSERDRAYVAQAGPAILNSGWTGDSASVRQRAVDAAAGGVTELAYGPTGPDVARELEAFAAAVRGT
ncbi:MAG TPA: LLM class flavin-dependent oxidoreductase [Acidimicrobiia bacterium]|nr:LLM class flavin-dependent oxidoreductase [Acidimicrobiia bacterium]